MNAENGIAISYDFNQDDLKERIKALNAEKMIFAQNDSALDHIRTDLYASVQGVLISNAIRDYSEYLQRYQGKMLEPACHIHTGTKYMITDQCFRKLPKSTISG